MDRARWSAIALMLWLVCGSSAAAGEPQDLAFGAEVSTEFPVSLGGSLWLELPGRVRIHTEIGYVPRPYVRAINSVLVRAHAYDDRVADLIELGLHNALSWRLQLGWRPSAPHGGYFEVGYGLVAFGGSLTMTQALAAATGQPVPNGDGEDPSYELSSILHMIDVDVGWQWIAARGLSFRFGLGCALTVASETHVKRLFIANDPQLFGQFERMATDFLDTNYQRYVFTPTISFAVGWRFLPWLEKGWGHR